MRLSYTIGNVGLGEVLLLDVLLLLGLFVLVIWPLMGMEVTIDAAKAAATAAG